MSFKRTFSDAFESQTTELVPYSQPERMPSYASRLGSKKRGKFGRTSYKPMARRGFPKYNSVTIARTVNYDVDFTADVAHGFGFSSTNLWVNGTSSTAIPGASELTALFDLIRIAKVEVTLLPGCDSLNYANNSLSSGTRNIPYVYTAYDPNDSGNPSLSDIQQNNTCKTDSFNKVIKRTIYPQMTVGSQLLTDIGQNRRNIFVKSGVDSPWFGYKVYMDLQSVALTYDIARISFKIFYECRNTI